MNDAANRTIDDAVAYPYAADVIYKIRNKPSEIKNKLSDDKPANTFTEVYYAGVQRIRKGKDKKTCWHIFYEPGEKMATKHFIPFKELSQAEKNAITQEQIIPEPRYAEFIEDGRLYDHKKLGTYTADIISHTVELINARFNAIKQKETLADRVNNQ